ncbi:hypothetical protein [Spartinivicinus marinus]|nr:hypothetical protein [Spartinivicinus marinus]MCX4026150.1 hypothetical protein [Spartinivicinus marinus]
MQASSTLRGKLAKIVRDLTNEGLTERALEEGLKLWKQTSK